MENTFEQEFERCKNDRDYFIEHYCVFFDEQGRIRKPRQLGFSNRIAEEAQMHMMMSIFNNQNLAPFSN